MVYFCVIFAARGVVSVGVCCAATSSVSLRLCLRAWWGFAHVHACFLLCFCRLFVSVGLSPFSFAASWCFLPFSFLPLFLFFVLCCCVVCWVLVITFLCALIRRAVVSLTFIRSWLCYGNASVTPFSSSVLGCFCVWYLVWIGWFSFSFLFFFFFLLFLFLLSLSFFLSLLSSVFLSSPLLPQHRNVTRTVRQRRRPSGSRALSSRVCT